MKSSTDIFRENLIWLMEENGFSQSTLADRAGVQFGSVNRWIHGRFMPEMASLEKLASVFDVTAADLLNPNLKDRKDLTPVSFDPTANYVSFYHRLFGNESRAPGEIIKVMNIAAGRILPENHWNVLIRRYNLDGSGYAKMEEIAQDMNVSRQRISQIIQKAEGKLRLSYQTFTDVSAKLNARESVHIDSDSTHEICTCIMDLLYDFADEQERIHADTDRQPVSVQCRNLMAVPTTDLTEYLSHRAINSLMRAGLRTLGNVLSVSETQMRGYRGVGDLVIGQVRDMKRRMFCSPSDTDRFDTNHST